MHFGVGGNASQVNDDLRAVDQLRVLALQSFGQVSPRETRCLLVCRELIDRIEIPKFGTDDEMIEYLDICSCCHSKHECTHTVIC